jgi:excisionase family DNA binding protein
MKHMKNILMRVNRNSGSHIGIEELKMDKLYKPIEIAKLFNISTSCIYKKAESGELPSIKIGTALRFSEENVNEYLEKCRRNKNNDSI